MIYVNYPIIFSNTKPPFFNDIPILWESVSLTYFCKTIIWTLLFHWNVTGSNIRKFRYVHLLEIILAGGPHIAHWGSEKKFLQFDHVNVRYNEKGLPIPKTMWRLDPVMKLFKVHSLIHNSLICHKFFFRKLSAFLHFIFISADLAAFGCCL